MCGQEPPGHQQQAGKGASGEEEAVPEHNHLQAHEHHLQARPLSGTVFNNFLGNFLWLEKWLEMFYRADGVDGPQEIERNKAAARHSWVRQNTWLLLSFFASPVRHPPHPPCTLRNGEKLVVFTCKCLKI